MTPLTWFGSIKSENLATSMLISRWHLDPTENGVYCCPVLPRQLDVPHFWDTEHTRRAITQRIVSFCWVSRHMYTLACMDETPLPQSSCPWGRWAEFRMMCYVRSFTTACQLSSLARSWLTTLTHHRGVPPGVYTSSAASSWRFDVVDDG